MTNTESENEKWTNNEALFQSLEEDVGQEKQWLGESKRGFHFCFRHVGSHLDMSPLRFRIRFSR